MTRDEMISNLINRDIEMFFDRDDPADYLAYLLENGIKGYKDMSNQEIVDEYCDTFGIVL